MKRTLAEKFAAKFTRRHLRFVIQECRRSRTGMRDDRFRRKYARILLFNFALFLVYVYSGEGFSRKHLTAYVNGRVPYPNLSIRGLRALVSRELGDPVLQGILKSFPGIAGFANTQTFKKDWRQYGAAFRCLYRSGMSRFFADLIAVGVSLDRLKDAGIGE